MKKKKRKKRKMGGLKMVLNTGGEPVLVGFKDWLAARRIVESADNKDDDLDFFEKRRDGAKKMSAAARAKGGPAMLTHWHFFAKDKQYAEVLRAIKSKRKKDFFEMKYNSFMSKLHRGKLDQKEFQTVSGQLEVWGEALSRLF